MGREGEKRMEKKTDSMKEWTELQYLDCVRTVLGCQRKKKKGQCFEVISKYIPL